MATVTEPILTDATGQDIVDKLDELVGAVRPTASDIPLTPPSGMTATNVQDGFTEIKQSLSNLVKSTTVTGTTTSSGALAIPNELKSKPLIDLHYDSANGLVFRRDNDYLTCLALSLQPFSNTSVSITVWYLDV